MNIWRQSPSARLREFGVPFVKQAVAQALPDVAEDFFEYTAPVPPSSGQPTRMLMGMGL